MLTYRNQIKRDVFELSSLAYNIIISCRYSIESNHYFTKFVIINVLYIYSTYFIFVKA